MIRKLHTIERMGLGSLLLSPALAACTVGPAYTPPMRSLHRSTTWQAPPAYRAAPSRRWITGGPGSTTRCW